MVKKEFLQSHALFGGISDAALEHIIPLLKQENFSAGQFIVNEGEEGDRLYFICEGQVEVLKQFHSPDGQVNKRLALLGKGDTFGEMELIDIQRRSASVKAVDNVTVLTLSNADIYTIYNKELETFTLIIMNLAREISRRLRTMDILVGSCLYAGSEDKNQNE